MRWNLRMKAAERGIWKSTQMRRLLADAGLEVSHGKMSALWTSTPVTIRLEDLDMICAVLECQPSDLLIAEPEKVASRREELRVAVGDSTPGPGPGPVLALVPRLGRQRTTPPA